MKAIHLENDLQELFFDLHATRTFKDGKTISDAILLLPSDEILAKYRSEKSKEGFDILTFYKLHFNTSEATDSGYKTDPDINIADHIEKLWTVLTRTPSDNAERSSRIGLPYPYIVPGGRFNEIYYWDSYFTMLGLKDSGRIDMLRNMVANFSHMLSEFGLIPNGNRTYYLGRSQPPFFANMIDLLATIDGDETYAKYLNSLHIEYQFWMDGIEKIASVSAYKRLVNIDGGILNRYYDNIEEPRTEMYSDDVELIESGGQQLVTHIRAACESGWDFSSRWLRDPMNLDTIHTTEILPIDLNCLIYHLELTLSKAHQTSGNQKLSDQFLFLSEERKEHIQFLLFDDNVGCFMDYDFKMQKHTSIVSAACVYPLYFNIASKEQAADVVIHIENSLLKPGGLVSTDINSGQQWDSPNGWAPQQWMAYIGLKNYGYDELAETIKTRWTTLNEKIFKNTGKLMEKYNVVDIDLESGGGEYPVQDGFGWTNGVYLALKNS